MSSRLPSNVWDRAFAFVSLHWKLIGALGTILVFALGNGAYFSWQENQREKRKTRAAFSSQLAEYRTSINALVPQYVLARDKQVDETSFAERVHYYSLRDQLVDLFERYNELEATLSELKGGGADLWLPDRIITPRPPKVRFADDSPTMVKAGEVVTAKLIIELQKDDVVEAVNKSLILLLNEHGEGFKQGFYEQACKRDRASMCTFLGEYRTHHRLWGRPRSRERELFRKGCELGDRLGCELLAHDEFLHEDYLSAETWLLRACELKSADGCGFLGSLQASKVLGDQQNAESGRDHLEKSCEWGSKLGCYALAVLNVSGLVERNVELARSRLQRSCELGLQQACSSLGRFDEFQKCEYVPNVADTRKASTVQIECESPSEKPLPR